MTYKSVNVVLTDESLVDEILTAATAMARKTGAHLDVLCLGVDRSQSGYYYAGASAIVLQETISQATEEATQIESRAKQALEGSGVLWSIETGVAQLADLGRHIANRARFSDLALLPRPYRDDVGIELENVTEATLFDAQVPVLIIPPGGLPDIQPKRVLIGWDESNEAMNAVRAALPLLQQADDVHVAVVAPPPHGPNRSDPGGLLSQYLSRHGVRVQIDVLSKTLPRVSDVLSRHALDTAADLIVMGAYGHSRFREAIFGGATRDMLESSKLPVFMAH